jgi:prepilin-type N-terminal cleavage/methylation domain-containing protein
MKSVRRKCLPTVAGYSLVEMMMTLAIALILLSVAMPMMIGAIQGYRLNSAAQQVANFVDLARYTAIRNNRLLIVQTGVTAGRVTLYMDFNGNGQADPNEPRIILPGDIAIANGDSLAPDGNSFGLRTNLQGFTTQITFDSRGVLNFGGGMAPTSYFLAIGFSTQVGSGYRAVTVTPMGQTKMWKGPASGLWSAL